MAAARLQDDVRAVVVGWKQAREPRLSAHALAQSQTALSRLQGLVREQLGAPPRVDSAIEVLRCALRGDDASAGWRAFVVFEGECSAALGTWCV